MSLAPSPSGAESAFPGLGGVMRSLPGRADRHHVTTCVLVVFRCGAGGWPFTVRACRCLVFEKGGGHTGEADAVRDIQR